MKHNRSLSGCLLKTSSMLSTSQLGYSSRILTSYASMRSSITSLPRTASAYQHFRLFHNNAELNAVSVGLSGQKETKGKAKAKAKAKGKGKEKHPSQSASRYPSLPPGWSTVIGVECHAQISSPTKLFSSSPIPPFTPPPLPNTFSSPFDASYPGTLPRLDSFSILQAVRAALAFNCTIPSLDEKDPSGSRSGDPRGISWDRKHYFYSDLTAGWQITQKYAPLAFDGHLNLLFDEGSSSLLNSKDAECKVRIEQIQVEQDTAKSSHLDTPHELSSSASTLIDLNRSNTPLLEIVSGPDMRTPEQAGSYVLKLQEILRRIGVSDGNMDEGSLRCDVNVSIHRDGEEWGTRCEVKNVNSVRFLMNAIASEQQRHLKLLQSGQRVIQETRGYDEMTGTTYRLRSKELSMDYRFMPDPNLPPLLLTKSQLSKLKNSLPELPDERRLRIKQVYGLSSRDVGVLMKIGDEGPEADSNREVKKTGSEGEDEFSDPIDYYEELARPETRSNQSCANWLIHELMKIANSLNLTFKETSRGIHPQRLGELIDLVDGGMVTGTSARSVLSSIVTDPSILPQSSESATSGPHSSSGPIFSYLKSNLLLQLSSEELEPLILDAMKALPEETELVRKGDERVLRRLIGEVMKNGKGRTDGKKVEQSLREMLMK